MSHVSTMNIGGHQSARRRLPRLMREFGESNWTLAYSLGLAVAVAFIISFDAPTWSLVLATALAPFAAAAYFWINPLNPYKMSAESVDYDAMAQKLITLLRSKEAKRHCLKTALLMSLVLTGCVLPISTIQKSIDLHSTVLRDFQLIMAGFFILGPFCAVIEMQFLLRWAFSRWELR